MSNFEFKSQICTNQEQSRKLLELGLKPESADMAHISFGGGGMMIRPYNWVSTTEVDIENFYPAWSLHRLMELLDMNGTAFSDITKAYDTCINIMGGAVKFNFIGHPDLKKYFD